MSKTSCETAEMEAYQLNTSCTLPKEKLNSLTERLQAQSQQGVGNIVKSGSLCQKGPLTIPVDRELAG